MMPWATWPTFEVNPAWIRGWISNLQWCLPTQTTLNLEADQVPNHLNHRKHLSGCLSSPGMGTVPLGKPRMESSGWEAYGSCPVPAPDTSVCCAFGAARQSSLWCSLSQGFEEMAVNCANYENAGKLFWHLMNHYSSALKMLCICLSFAKRHQYECVWFCKVYFFRRLSSCFRLPNYDSWVSAPALLSSSAFITIAWEVLGSGNQALVQLQVITFLSQSLSTRGMNVTMQWLPSSGPSTGEPGR